MDDATAHKRIERFERSMQRLLGEYDELKAENDDLKAEFDHKMRETIRTGVAIGARLCGRSVDEARAVSDRIMKVIEEEERRAALEERKRCPTRHWRF